MLVVFVLLSQSMNTSLVYTNIYRDHQTYKDIGQKLKAIGNFWTRQEHGLNPITKMLQYICVCIIFLCVQCCVFK